jgi:hypothetical protein
MTLRLAGALLVTALLTAPTSGCVGCTDDSPAGIVLTILDARTNGEISADYRDVQVRISDGDWIQFDQGGPQVGLANSRPGTYEIVVAAPGYVTWTQSGIKVTEGGLICRRVKTVQVIALLEPEA